MEKTKIFIDTDIGDDIDDAFALCLAMASPEIEILGVTTVFRTAKHRAKLAKALLTAGGFQTVPVHAGISEPVRQRTMFGAPIDFAQPPFSYQESFDNVQYDGDDAVEFFLETLGRAEGPITLVTLGALTNIAEAYRRNPALMKRKLRKISVMGGAYERNYPEYNFSCDPEAAKLVLSSGIACDLIGIDVTFQCKLSELDLKHLSDQSAEVIQLLISMCRSWGHDVYLHDPLALMNAFCGKYLTFQDREIGVETLGEFSRGYAVTLSDFNWRRDVTGNLRVAVGVNSQEFVAECMERFLSLAREAAKRMAI